MPAPTITITSPASGDTVSGLVPIHAVPVDNSGTGIFMVAFRVDNPAMIPIQMVYFPGPYTWNLDSTQYADGPHAILARAADNASGVSSDAVIDVTIHNAAPIAPPPPPPPPPPSGITSAFAQKLYDAIAPLAYDDAKLGYPLAKYCTAIAKMFDQVNDFTTFDADGKSGWARMLDVDRAPAIVLPWLGQFVGVDIPAGTSENNARALVKNVGGFKRGTTASILGAITDLLTGTKRVIFYERYGGDAYQLHVSTWAAETPDPVAVEQAIIAQKPAGIVLTYTTITGGDFNSLRDTHTSFAAVATTFIDFNEILSNPTKP